MLKRGFFDFLTGGRSAAIEEEAAQKEYAKIKQNEEQNFYEKKEKPQYEITAEIETYCIDKLNAILTLSRFSGQVRHKKTEGNKLILEVYDAAEDLGRIIGKKGQNLEGYQTLLRHFVIREFSVPIRVVIDAEDYRNRRHGQGKFRAKRAGNDTQNSTQDESNTPSSEYRSDDI
jgi:predicted RNA-binding protein Jag